MNEIYNFLSYHEKLSSSGMPTAEQMKLVAQAGVELIVNLAPHDVPKAIPNEAALVEALGMQYINIPVHWGTPTRDGLNIFMDTLDANKGRKVHVHCEANFRASAFILMYRVLRLGWKTDDAFEVMHSIWDEDAYPVWKMFIEDAIKRSETGA
ncbi:MAG TPA: protein tyrosine phosphatase family protein [Anaerolineales bacterium]|nr:protein tyrosine phosphatase family protein [Anaerolineales bacterium]HNC08384.1 protein tyrosine phosphatase family protein [Anaerolineales bacterium]